MNFKILNRQSLSAAIIIFYLIPLLFFSAYSITLMSPHKSWALLSLGLLLIAFGTLSLMLLIFYWEKAFQDKKQHHLLFPPPHSMTHSSNEKETKVTSFDSSLIFNPLPYQDSLDHLGFKENSREISLLQMALKTSQEQHEQVTKTLDLKNQELHKQEEENKQLQFKAQQITQDFADYKLFSDEQLKQKQLQLNALQQLLEDQRSEMEKRQEQIHQLDTKVHDLSYEIKTLLYLHEEEVIPPQSFPVIKENVHRTLTQGNLKSEQETVFAVLEVPTHSDIYAFDHPIRTSVEAATLLKKCLDIAQKLTGANYYSNESSRYREFSSSYYAIDQRRLFENLRSETGALIIVYSQKEQKLLFVNQASKTLLGWSPEKFVADFSSIMQEGINDWKKALNMLTSVSESQVRLLAKTKNGQEILLHCHLGVIQTGLFRQYVIGVLYPA